MSIGPDLTIQINRLDGIAADHIFTTAQIGYWCSDMEVNWRDREVYITSVYVTENGNRYLVSGPLLLRAINQILAGKHVGSVIREQVIRDAIEWEASPKYGPPFDAEVCDYLIQIAAFGEVRYG